MNPQDNFDPLDRMALEIEERRKKTEAEMWIILNRIFQQPLEALTVNDKAFLQARRSYLSRAQLEEYRDILKENVVQVNLSDLTRAELNEKAINLGVQEVEKLPSKQAVIDAINDAK